MNTILGNPPFSLTFVISLYLLYMSSVQHFYLSMLKPIELKLRTELPENCYYHSADHTMDVLEQVGVVGEAQGLNEHELAIVRVAALFHDVGFVVGRKNHEAESCGIFRDYALGYELSFENMRMIEGCILATKIPQSPSNLLESVLCDADLDYLGRDDFGRISDLLFRELIACGEIQTRNQWNEVQVRFLTNHAYHTHYSKTERTERLIVNLENVKSQIEGLK